MFSIGAASRKTGIKIPTIRYYETEGLASPSERSSGNQRRYSPPDIARLTFIKHARDLGLKLDDIRELLHLSANPDQPCAVANKIAADHLVAVQERIAKLQALETELSRIAHGCTGKTVGECYVIEALSDHALCQQGH
ncbi:MAG: helix-turn-helix domain-containing protein [Rhodobacteraceae bacterium]|nr:helix-turn-helix domain-containing protein [Paracoccaceae bacterium]